MTPGRQGCISKSWKYSAIDPNIIQNSKGLKRITSHLYRGNPTVPEQDASAPAAARAPALDQVPAPVHEPDIVPVSGKTRSWEKPNAGRSEAYKRIDAAFADLMQRKQAPAASPAALPAYKPSASAHQLPEEFEIRLPSDEDYVWSRYGLQGDGEHPRGWDHEAQAQAQQKPLAQRAAVQRLRDKIIRFASPGYESS